VTLASRSAGSKSGSRIEATPQAEAASRQSTRSTSAHRRSRS